MSIPEPEIQALKDAVDLAGLIRSRGIKLSPRGRDLVGLCPFHADSSPSLVVTPSKNLWHCFSCGAGGDVIEFVRRMDGLDFPEAIERLQAEGPRRETTHREEIADGAAASSPSAAALFEAVIAHYRRTFKTDTTAQMYLQARRIAGGDIVERFGVGYADGSLLRILGAGQTKEAAATRAVLRTLGALRDTGREHLRGCVVFPLYDANGAPVSLYGRRIADRGKIEHVYLPGPRRGLFHPQAYRQPELVLCESVIDALSFYAHGIPNVSCAYGANGVTDEMITAMQAGGVRLVYIAFDADRAGDEGAERLAHRLRAEKIETRRVRFPLATDANDFVRAVSEPALALRELLREAEATGERIAATVTQPMPAMVATPSKQVRGAGESETVERDEIRIVYGERRYRVRGLFQNTSDHLLKINLRAERGECYHLDTFDILSARLRQAFIAQAAEELHVQADVLKLDLGRLLLRLEELQGERLRGTLAERKREIEISPERRERALACLRDPDLITNIVRDFETAGLIGERENALLGYLGALSRKTDSPLAIIIQSSSSAGKSALMEAILAFVPEEERIKFSMMTGQSLYYMQSRDLKHKIIAVSEEEGVERAKYAIKILQSEGRITIATTVKDPASGLPDTQEFLVEGPVMFLLTTTSVEIDEELQNRCLILMINESREQTARIQRMQREKRSLEGILSRRAGSNRSELHQDVQRMLRPLHVANRFSERIQFPDTRLRLRRDQEKFLTLIETIALLHQHQRKIHSARDSSGEFEYIEAEESDVALAAHLLGPVFGVSLDDLAPQTRRLLELIDAFVTERCSPENLERRQFRFTMRQLREYSGWGDTRLRKHMARLEELEYLLVHGGGRGQFIEYELCCDAQGASGDRFIPGIPAEFAEAIDPALRAFLSEFTPPDAEFTPPEGRFTPRTRPQNTPETPPSHGAPESQILRRNGRLAQDFAISGAASQKTHIKGEP